MAKNVKLTKDQKRLGKAIRRLNACLDPEAVKRTLSAKDIAALDREFETTTLGYSEPRGQLVVLVPENDEDTDVESELDCTPRDKDVRKAYPDATPPWAALAVAEAHANELDEKVRSLESQLADLRRLHAGETPHVLAKAEEVMTAKLKTVYAKVVEWVEGAGQNIKLFKEKNAGDYHRESVGMRVAYREVKDFLEGQFPELLEK